MCERYLPSSASNTAAKSCLNIASSTIKLMHGGSRSRLVLDTLGRLWVLKLRNNPQHKNVVLNECLGTYIAQSIGLTVPPFTLMSARELLAFEAALTNEAVEENMEQIHFASSWVGHVFGGRTYDLLPTKYLPDVANVREFAGILALDVWLSNADRRQAVFLQQGSSDQLVAYWIDFGHWFGGEKWGQMGLNYPRLYRDPICYRHVRSLADFEPWLSAIENFPIEELCTFAHTLPNEWLSDNSEQLERLLVRLTERQNTLKNDLLHVVRQSLDIFVGWKSQKPQGTKTQLVPPDRTGLYGHVVQLNE